MRNIKIVAKIANFLAIVSVIFVVLSIITTYLLIQIVSSGAPTDYIALSVLSNAMPYLFVAVLSLAVASIFWGMGEESQEIDVPYQSESAEAAA